MKKGCCLAGTGSRLLFGSFQEDFRHISVNVTVGRFGHTYKYSSKLLYEITVFEAPVKVR